MKRTASPTYRFGTVAAAIGVNDQTLRNWLFRNKDLDLFTKRPPGGWRWFDERDVWVLSLVVEFMRFGATIAEAVDASRQAMDIRRNARSPETLPDTLYAAPSGYGWEIDEDKSLAIDRSGSPSVLEIPMRTVLSRAVRRLCVSHEGD
jgi:hypothetical protein